MGAAQSAIAAYRAAINAAIVVFEKETATAADVAAAITALNEATTKFNAAKKIDKSVLKAAINEAEANIEKPMGADAEAIKAYRAAIEAAIEVFEKENAKAEEISLAYAALIEATAVFDEAKIVDKSALETAIT